MSLKRKFFNFLYLSIKPMDYPFIDGFRAAVVRGLLKGSAKKLIIRAGVNLHDYRNLTLGNNVSINHGCFLSCIGGLTIGNNVSIGHNTSILTTEHSFSDLKTPIKEQPVVEKPVVIGDNVWIAANVTILAGVHLANGTVVAAGAVVKKDVLEENSIVGGIPARHLKFRTDS